MVFGSSAPADHRDVVLTKNVAGGRSDRNVQLVAVRDHVKFLVLNSKLLDESYWVVLFRKFTSSNQKHLRGVLHLVHDCLRC